MIENLLILVAIAALAVASYVDLKVREVPDWISYGLIFTGLGLRLIDSISIWSFKPILFGMIGLGVTFVLALLMFYTGIWGGGDSKILMGLGAVIGIERFDTLPFLVIFLLAAFVISGVYGVFYALYLASKHWKDFKKELKDIRHRKNIFVLRIISLVILLVSTASFFFINGFMGLLILMLSAILFLAIQSWTFMKAVEKSALIYPKKVKDLVEGDWVVKDVVVKGRRICGPKGLGLTKDQISLLKKYNVKSVIVKDGIPFVPSFLAAYVLSLLLL